MLKKLCNNIKKKSLLISIMGCVYLLIEVIWRMGSDFNEHGMALKGESSFWMLLVGGLSGYIIGLMNENNITKKLKVWVQCIIGMSVILILEFISGYYCNIVNNWDIWDYTDLPFNIMGQVSLLFSFFWFLLVPFAIWLDDLIRYLLFKEDKIYNLFKVYKDLFLLK